MNRQIQIVALAVAALVLGGGGFVAGMNVGPELAAKADASAQATGGPAARQQGAGGAGGRQFIGGAGAAAAGAAAGVQTIGRVIGVSDGSITLEVRTPGSDTPRSVIALVGSGARVVKTVETDIKVADIKPGDQVLVVGTPDQATGTISATAVVDGFNVLGGPGAAGGAGGQGGARPSGSPRASGSPRP